MKVGVVNGPAELQLIAEDLERGDIVIAFRIPSDKAHTEAHLAALSEAFAIHVERESERSGVWERSGLRGQAMHVFAKAERAFTAVARGDVPNIDNFLDLINYSAFAIRLIRNAEHDASMRGLPVDKDKLLDGEWPWNG